MQEHQGAPTFLPMSGPGEGLRMHKLDPSQERPYLLGWEGSWQLWSHSCILKQMLIATS